MGGIRARYSLPFLGLFCLILIGLSVTAGGCDTQADAVKGLTNAYYDDVVKGDVHAQESLWVPDRQDEAARDAQAWAQRDKEGLKLSELHVSDGPAADQRIVHVTVSVDDKARPGRKRYESKTLLVQLVNGKWLIRDVR